MADFVRFRGTRSQAVGRVVALVRQVTAGGDAATADAVLTVGAVALLSKVQQSFLALSRTGHDPATGISWAPLKRETIARRRTTPGELKSLGVGGTRVRGFLTPAQDKRWRALFASRLAHFRAQGLDEGSAKAHAAQIAWAVLKKEGAKTKLDVLGSRKVDMGRDTGALLRSLTPGVETSPPADNQVREISPGRITVGSNLPYAARFHARRHLWPTDGRLPPVWAQAVAGALARSMLRAAVRSLSG